MAVTASLVINFGKTKKILKYFVLPTVSSAQKPSVPECKVFRHSSSVFHPNTLPIMSPLP